MPVISMFFGIIVRMYADDHNPPHVHVSYQGNEAAFTFDGELINGDLPRKQRHMVQGWIAMHEDDLRARMACRACSTCPSIWSVACSNG